MKAYVILWNVKKGLRWDNVDQIVETKEEAQSITDISNDEEAQQNTPGYGFIRVNIAL